MNAVQTTPIVTVVDGNVTTLSTDVAAFFEKRHDVVLRAIENIRSNLDSDRLHNFAETEVTRESPLKKGTLLKSKAYRLTIRHSICRRQASTHKRRLVSSCLPSAQKSLQGSEVHVHPRARL